MGLLKFVLLSLLFIACTANKEKEGEVVLNIYDIGKVKGLDPIMADDRYAGQETSRVYEGLLAFHYLKRPYVLIPALAENLPVVSDDGLTYTFTIKKGIFFHDSEAFPQGKGRELVAEDFVYSLKRLADARNNSSGWWLLQNKIKGLDEWRDKYSKAKDNAHYNEFVEGMNAPDKYTLKFVLKQKFPQFLYAFAMPFTFVVAHEVVDHYKDSFLNHPVGTGPYLLPEFKQTDKIVYKKNPKYRDNFYPTEGEPGDEEKGLLVDAGKKLPFADTVIYNVIVEDQPRWLNFFKGKLDYVKIPKDNFAGVVSKDKTLSKELSDKGFRLTITPEADVTFTALNYENPLFKNIKLRQAMALAYDGKRAIELFYANVGVPAQSVIPPGIAGYDPSYVNPYMQHDIEKAKKLLAEAGYPDGKGLPEITHEIPESTTNRQIAEHLQRCMAQIGIKIKINTNTWPELQKKVHTRSHMTYGMAWSADYPDAENFLQLLYGPNKAPGANGANYDDPVFNKMFDEAKVMQDSPERTELYRKLNMYIGEQVPWIFGLHREEYMVTQAWLKNYKFTDFTHGREKYLNIDTAKKTEYLKKL